jgi:transposase
MKKLHKGQRRCLRRAMQRERNVKSRLRIQMIILRDEGMSQPEIADVTGTSLSTVNRAHMAYAHEGLKGLKAKPRGGRMRENMTKDEEKELLAQFAKAAGVGELLNIHDMKRAYEEKIGHPTGTNTIYKLLARHGWRKLMPRPHHPDRNEASQKRFKKKVFQSPFAKPGAWRAPGDNAYELCSPTKPASDGSIVPGPVGPHAA